MATRYAWVLNLDADAELARPVGYHPTRRMRELVQQFKPQLEALIGTDSIVLPDDALKRPLHRDYIGRAWSPTPRALHLLRQSGASVPAAPSLACLQHVASRRFSASLGQALAGAHYTESRDALLAGIAEHAASGGCVLKRNHGFAGRGQRRISALPTPDDVRWLEQSLSLGGVQLEPWLQIQNEYALHAHLSRTGEIKLGAVTAQHTDAKGCWLSSERISGATLDPALEREMYATAERVAQALAAEGYFGPLGIDSYTYQGPTGALLLNAKSDVNPRYTMGYAVGMGSAQP